LHLCRQEGFSWKRRPLLHRRQNCKCIAWLRLIRLRENSACLSGVSGVNKKVELLANPEKTTEILKKANGVR
jgi:hypothetical protein